VTPPRFRRPGLAELWQRGLNKIETRIVPFYLIQNQRERREYWCAIWLAECKAIDRSPEVLILPPPRARLRAYGWCAVEQSGSSPGS
jgi:hypothetical protein